MSVDSRIINAISPYVTDVCPNIYDGDSKTYVVYTYSDMPMVHAESHPDVIRCLVQVNLYLPKGQNPRALKRNICEALSDAGFTYPSIVNASDKGGQHYSFTCETIDIEESDGNS